MRIKYLIAILLAGFAVAYQPGQANAGFALSITIEPPALPVYDQPPVPGPGYIWTPGYWAWDDDGADYYWVPGAWVPAPQPGYLWTPGYWGWGDGVYLWHEGYWGPHVGFYGGVCYGFGYTSVGFFGGEWRGGAFFYNRSVVNVSNTTVINNVYSKTVINNNVTNVSYNGGANGIKAAPTQTQLAAANEPHLPKTADQTTHQALASKNPDLKSSVNHGTPKIAAVTKAGDFSKSNIVPAKAAGSSTPALRANNTLAKAGGATAKPNQALNKPNQALNKQVPKTTTGRTGNTTPNNKVTSLNQNAAPNTVRSNKPVNNFSRPKGAGPRQATAFRKPPPPRPAPRAAPKVNVHH